MEPLRHIPEKLRHEYTLYGEIPVYKWYFNDSIKANTIIWDNQYLQSYIDRFTFENIINNRHGNENYKGASLYHVNVCQKYIDHIKNKNVAVIGTQYPWIESILVNAGARSVTTVEYNVPICNHAIIKTISYTDFCKSSDKYDAIFSYSSIEHSGLGRYGDPLNPNGDIETMEEIYRCLHDGAYCFLGIPVGKDCIVWNAHRIYGEKRLKMIYLDKFKEIEWIGHNKDYLNTCHESSENPIWDIQPIIVLQKCAMMV